MNARRLCLAIGLMAAVLTAQGLTAQSTWTPPRTPDGHPDFQGVWVNNIATPLERPEALAGRATLTDQELAAMKKKAHEMFSGNGDAAFGDTVFNVVKEW